MRRQSYRPALGPAKETNSPQRAPARRAELPDPGSADGGFSQTAVIRSDQPFALEVAAKTTDAAAGEYLRRLHASGIIAELKLAELKVLQALLLYSNGGCLAETHCLVAWPSVPRLTRELGIGRAMAHIAIKRLIETHGLLRRLSGGSGGKSTTYQLIPPPDADPGRPTVQHIRRSTSRRDSQRARWEGLLTGAGGDDSGGTIQPIGRSARALSDGQRARYSAQSARATRRSAPAPDHKKARAHAHARQDQTLKESNAQEQQQPLLPFFGPPTAPLTSGADAVVAALMQAGVERPVAEGLATTSTAELVTTAIADAKRRRDVENVPGYIVYLVRNPGHLRSRQQRRREQSRANLAESEQELRAAADERAAARAVGEREAVEMVRALSPANREHWRGIVVSATEEDWKKQAWAAADPLTMPTLCIEIARRLKSAGKDPRIKVAAQAAANRNPSTPSATRRT